MDFESLTGSVNFRSGRSFLPLSSPSSSPSTPLIASISQKRHSRYLHFELTAKVVLHTQGGQVKHDVDFCIYVELIMSMLLYFQDSWEPFSPKLLPKRAILITIYFYNIVLFFKDFSTIIYTASCFFICKLVKQYGNFDTQSHNGTL